MTATETFTCIVCQENDTQESLFEYCNGCSERYHYNHTNTAGKDCGDAWIDDEEEGMNFFCRNCMDQARADDQTRMRDFAAAAMQGTVSAEQMAEMLRAFATGSGGAQFGSTMPPMPATPAPAMPANPLLHNIPGVAAAGMPDTSGPISAADLFARFGMAPPPGVQFGSSDDAEASRPATEPRETRDAGDAPPLLSEQRRASPRRYRRIE